MRRGFEHAQLRRYFHCHQLPQRLPPHRLQLNWDLPRARSHIRKALSSPNTRFLSSASRPSNQHVSHTAWPDISSPRVSSEAEATKETDEDGVELDDDRYTGLGHWAAQVEQFLPKELCRVNKHESRDISRDGSDFKRLLGILTEARTRRDVDILSVMVLNHRRHKAAMFLADVLLNPLATVPRVFAEEQLPSNIVWPVDSLSEVSRRPLELDHDLHVDKRAAMALVRASQSQVGEDDLQRVLQIVWPFLATLVKTSTSRPSEEAKDIMSTVHQILARMHNLDLVPPTVYTYAVPHGSTTVQKPPILNLLNSRILSTLSDAVWRAQQDDAIAQALKEGKSFDDVSHHPPGGRFRLRLRELGPEVWLEFILWCCTEGGLTAAGSSIINMLQEDPTHRWSAVHWTTGPALENKTPPIDWERVKRRHGGPVGQREAYSGDQPFVEMQRRTISAEVVLALVECSINSLAAASSASGSVVDDVASQIRRLVSFLEPHGLPSAYFDYLAVRFLQTEPVPMQRGPDTLRKWVSIISQLRSLDSVEGRPQSGANFDFDCVVEHSELSAGVLHQALQVYIGLNLVTKAVDTFTDLQKLVDARKLEAIGEFLSLTMRPRDGFFTARPRGHLDFTNSHGQLPMYKLAPFLKLVADAKLFGLGDWLLFSEDVDGPLIPPSAYRQPSIAVALCHYAAAKEDPSLIQSILMARRDSKRRLTVNLLRALINFHIHVREWASTSFLLQELKNAEGGGYSPSIVAHLAASILRLETEASSHVRDSHLKEATTLLQDILGGRYNSSAGDFRIHQRVAFRRQTGLLLRFLENLPDSEVQAISEQFRRLFPPSNEALLHPDTFNILLSAVVDTRGAIEGRRIWEMFCKVLAPETDSSYAGHDGLHADSRSNPNRGGSEDVPFERHHTEDDQWTYPIVIPDLRTLQIIVTGALTETQAGPVVSREAVEELHQLLQWARPLFKTFELSDEDIEAEMRIPGSLPDDFSRRSRNTKRQRPRQTLQEKNRPNVGSQFTSGALEPRPAHRRRQK